MRLFHIYPALPSGRAFYFPPGIFATHSGEPDLADRKAGA